MKNNKNKNYQGFSLLEMMISMFIFVLTIITAVSIFSTVAHTRHKSREIQKNMEDARTALDLMAKNMRMSVGLNNDGTDIIYMYNTSQGQCMSYKFEDNKLKMSQQNPSSGSCVGLPYNNEDYDDIIESDVSGSFDVVEASSTAPKTVGKATVVLIVDGIRLQTSVSFRDYNDIIQ